MQEPMDSAEEAKDLIQEHSREHFAIECPDSTTLNSDEFEIAYTKWLDERHDEMKADEYFSIHKGDIDVDEW